MLVRVGNRIYNPEREPVTLILSEADKANIAAMHPDCYRYTAFPEHLSKEDLNTFMNNEPKQGGCGLWHIWWWPVFDACEKHDAAYDAKTRGEDKRSIREIDREFLAGMKAEASGWKRLLVYPFYFIARLYGMVRWREF